MKIVRLCAAALLGCAAARVYAADFYIDPINGSDSGDGSATNPWQSLQAVFDAGLIETQDWPSYPYAPGMQLVVVNAGAPVRAGDTLWLRSGYHGDLVIEHAYNTAAITVAAEAGQSPQVRSLTVQAAQNWIVRGLSISPSYAATNEQITMVEISDHNYFGPAWDIEFSASDLFSVDDASSWGADEWVNLASSGIEVGAARISVHDNTLRNVRFGIGVDGAYASIRHNVIDGFSADGLRGLGDYDLFEYNRVQNDKIGDPDDPNHDDGFQSWSVGSDGQVGTGQVTGVVLRGNIFINSTDPNDPLRNSMQGIGCFDGFYVNWIVENNVVITDHWHGISFYGMRDSQHRQQQRDRQHRRRARSALDHGHRSQERNAERQRHRAQQPRRGFRARRQQHHRRSQPAVCRCFRAVRRAAVRYAPGAGRRRDRRGQSRTLHRTSMSKAGRGRRVRAMISERTSFRSRTSFATGSRISDEIPRFRSKGPYSTAAKCTSRRSSSWSGR